MTDVELALTLLRLAQERQTLTGVKTTTSGSEGFVLGATDEWVLVSILDSMHYDGWIAHRTRDVTRVEVHVHERFRVRALRQRGQWPPPTPAAISLDSDRAVLAMASAHCRLVRFEVDDDLVIGRVVRLADTEVEVREIDVAAVFDAEPTTYALSDLDLIGFGGEYDAALAEVGGEPPEPDKTG